MLGESVGCWCRINFVHPHKIKQKHTCSPQLCNINYKLVDVDCWSIVSNIYVNVPIGHPVTFQSAVEMGAAQFSPFGQGGGHGTETKVYSTRKMLNHPGASLSK